MTKNTYTVEVFVKTKRGARVETVRFPACSREAAVRTAEAFCRGTAVEAHNANPASGGGANRG